MNFDTSGNTADLRLGQGSFEMQRMLRQNAHEKAFEIKVIAQRQFEKQTKEMVQQGRMKHN